MDPKYRRLLQKHYKSIVDDLDVSDVQDRLYEKGYLSSEDYERIDAMNKSNRMDRTRDLLDTLIQNGTNAKYEIFVESLAKDYDWLWEKFKVEIIEPDMNESFEDSLSKGDVPRLPDHHVKRVALENTIATSLKQLVRHKIVALHGMSGSGKTCAAIGALRDNPELITDNFNGVVLWLNLGNCKTDDDIIAQQNKLLRKTTSLYRSNVDVQTFLMTSSISLSSIGSNGDSLSLSNLELNPHDLRDKLKVQFSEPPLKDALLVLDEVNDRKILNAFDIGCKILITTRDTEVVDNYQTHIIKIENSFQKEESLELFASFLDEPVSKLPRQAKKLHEVCKGSPFHIQLIGAQLAENKERLKYDPRHWDYYVKKLEKKEFSIFLTRPNNNPMKTIEVCINSLKNNVLILYKQLAILPDNVKVSAKVLGKLWNIDDLEVNSIMQRLKSKSLIIANYDRERRNYMYEVHDLIMNYLRTCLKEEEKNKLHDSFLRSYNYDKNNAPVEIVDDGYIAYYVGYHILHTNNYDQQWSLFKKLFLDLKFLGNKVRLSGPADVILDLQKYEDYIASDELDRDLIHSIKAYLMTHGADIHRFQCTDIVQSILQHETEGILFTKASELAQQRCNNNELYFEFLHEQDVDDIKHSTIDVKEEITCACFLGDYVLVGTQKGVVKFFHNPTNKLKKEYSDPDISHGFAVKWIGVAITKNPPVVSALYYNGAIKLWNIDDLDLSDLEDVIEEEPEEIHNNNLPCNVTILPDLDRGEAVRNCRWSVDEGFLITHTDHSVILFGSNGEKRAVIDNFENGSMLACCVPCNNDRYVLIATLGSRQGIDVIDLNTRERVMSFEGELEIENLQDVLSLPGTNKIITLTKLDITQYEFIIKKGNNTWKSKLIRRSKDIKPDLAFISFAVNKTGTLLFVSTDDSRVICIDLKTNSHLFDLDNRRGNVVAMAVSEILMWDEFIPGYDVLLTGTGTMENTAKVWHLDTSYISQATHKNGKVRLTTKFDVSFIHSASPHTPGASSTTSKELQPTPKRHQSFNHRVSPKKLLQNTRSLDRHALKPLNLKGICNNNESAPQPLLAVIDDKNSIQVMRGRKILTEISEKIEDLITTVKITPCNQHIIYGLHSGEIKRFTLRTKASITIMDIYSPVQYMRFVNPNLLIVAGENRCIMAHKLVEDGNWETVMLQKGNTFLGSQEIINDIQGVKKKHHDSLSHSESHSSIETRDRTISNNSKKGHLGKGSHLVQCFWTQEGLITVEHNATIKLWNHELKLTCVLHARKLDVNITCAAFRRNVIVICDSSNLAFQTFKLKHGSATELIRIQEQKMNNVITCCDLTADGNLLALGLDSGDVVVWNVKGQRQITYGLLRHHKHKVQSCSFSPVPDRLYRNSTSHPTPLSPSVIEDCQPPLVLVTMATEIVWWNITYDMRMRNGKMGRPVVNALTPLASPLENRAEVTSSSDTESSSNRPGNFFFDDGFISQHCWKDIWKGKTYKQGSKRKEILACIKLSGIYAKRLCHDDNFACFVTIDNTGHVHIMNVMNSECS